MLARSAKIVIDGLCALVALFAGFSIVFSLYTADWLGLAVRYTAHSAFAYVVFAMAASMLVKLDRKSWRFSSLNDFFAVVRAALISSAALLTWNFLFDRASNLPRSALFIIWLLDIGLLMSIRLALRMYRERSTLKWLIGAGSASAKGGGNTIVIGSAASVDSYLRDPRLGASSELIVAGAIVAGERWRLGEIRGVEAFGDPHELFAIIDSLRARSVAITNILVLEEGFLHDGTVGTDALVNARERNIRLLRLPRVSELAAWPDRGSPRDVKFEELLQRPSVRLDIAPVAELLRSRRVLVTGAGGSIGSELCRQLVGLGCAHLSCVDNSEFNLYTIDEELGRAGSGVLHSAILCDIRDPDAIAAVFSREQPEIVFHAAALKHVPLMEENPVAAVATNVLGTRNVRRAAERAGCSTFVLVSTDKSVAPSSVMGTTKRIAEAVTRLETDPQTPSDLRSVVVRFGNVLGSAGSVIPLFRAQIERGGPVTITHPDVERYFMTIPEAVLLILHAASLGRSAGQPAGHIYVLEMGEPIRIVDLAHQVAAAYHVELGRDVALEYVGLRPGEKLTEELIDEGERAGPSARDGIRLVRSPMPPQDRLTSAIDEMERLARKYDATQVRAALAALLADIRFPDSVDDSVPQPARWAEGGR